jgi:hypothetical protein
VAAWREQLNADPSRIGEGVGRCLAYGHELLSQGASASAVTLFGACAQALPAFPAIRAGLGAAYAAEDDVPAATVAYQEALLKLEGASWLSAPQKESLRRRVQRALDELSQPR